MKPKSHPLIRKTASSFRPSLVACGVALSPIAVTNSHAAIYYWNTTTTGTWATGGNWSDDPASGGVTGVVPGSGDSAVFNQSSVNGATLIQLDADAATTGITFNNTGTTAIQNFDATVRTLTLGSGGITVGATAGNPTISTGLSLSANQTWSGSGKTITIAGEVAGASRSLTKGSGGTVQFATGSNASLAAITSSGSADFGLISATGGSLAVSGNIQLGRSTAYNTAPTLAAPVAAVTNGGLYVNGGAVSSGSLSIGTANSSSSARVDSGSLSVSGKVLVANTGSSRWNILQVAGGTFTSSDATDGIVISPNKGTSTNNGEVYLSGGESTAEKIAFGAASDTKGGNGFFILGGGTLYLGNGGIVKASTTLGADLYNYTIGLNSGTLGAKADWSSSLNMTLGTNPTLKAADSSDVSKNIALNGNLAGGGFTKTGLGTLTLGGTATLTGTATGSAGTIYLPAGGSLSSNAIGGRGFWLDGGSLTTNAAVTSTFAAGASNAYLQSAGTASVGTFFTPNAGGELIKITGGGFTATAVSLNRTFSSNAIPTLGSPLAAPTTSGFYVNGSTAVANLGALNIGTGNSNSSARVDDGSVTVSGAVALGKKSGGSTRWDVLQINGGTFTAPDTSAGIVIGQNNGTSANNAELYLSGGTTTAGRIAFGATTDTVGGNGLLILAGGNLYVGTGGIVQANTTGLYNHAVGLTSGTLGAADDWSSALNMTLGANPTIKAADSLDAVRNITLSGVLSGTGFTKTGDGKLTLSGANTYTGTTTVSAGTLELAATTGSLKFVPTTTGVSNKITGAGTLTLKGAFDIDLTGADATLGNSWTLVDVGTLAETFDASFSVAGFTESSDVWTKPDGVTGNMWKFEESSGVLSYVVNPAAAGFSTWIGTFPAVGGLNQPGDDPDNDGAENLLEFVLNGNPAVSDPSILPVLSVTGSDLEFTFQRRDDSVSPETTQTFEWGTTLATWPGTVGISPAVAGPPASVTVTAGTPNDAVTDTVKVTIPKSEASPGGKIFGRLKVVKP